jgi:hypothetical protein
MRVGTVPEEIELADEVGKVSPRRYTERPTR